MKTERIKGVAFNDEGQLRATLSHYMDVYYNQTRLHSAIGYTSPMQWEKQTTN